MAILKLCLLLFISSFFYLANAKKKEAKVNYKSNFKGIDKVLNLGKYGRESPVETNLNFGIEHSRNTGGADENTDMIRGKLGWIRHSGRNISQEGLDITTKMFGSLGDGGVGIGQLQGIGEPQGNKWYYACRKDFFTPDSRLSELGAGEITFCNKNSLIGSKLEDIYQDSNQFCKQLGVPSNQEEEKGYDGVPWGVKFGKATPDKIRPKTQSKEKKAKEESLADIILGPLAGFYHTYPIIFMALYGSIILTVFAYLTGLITRGINPKTSQQEGIDDKIKEKRLKKILERTERKQKDQ